MALAVHNQESSLGEKLRDGRDEFRGLKNEAGEIATGIGRVARSEAMLAVSEVRDGVKATVQTSVWGGIAFAFGLVTLMWLPLPIAVGLAEIMPWWAASLITVAILAAITALVGMVAYRHFKSISLVPHEAIERVKEDKAWLTQQLSRNQS